MIDLETCIGVGVAIVCSTVWMARMDLAGFVCGAAWLAVAVVILVRNLVSEKDDSDA